jgi:hypothetical protein
MSMAKTSTLYLVLNNDKHNMLVQEYQKIDVID